MATSTPEPSAAGLLPETEAYLLLEQVRWRGRAPDCPHCGAPARGYLLATADGLSRRTRTGAPTARRLWKCRACRRQFSVLSGTVLQGTRVRLSAWVAAVQVLAAAGDRPVPGSEISRATGLGREAARHLLARWAAATECIAFPALPASSSAGSSAGDAAPVRGVDARTREVLAALLAIPAPAAGRVRDRTPSRTRPRPQRGPQLDLGRG